MNARRSTQGEFKVTTARFYLIHERGFYTCYITIISHCRGGSQSSESTLHECASQQESLQEYISQPNKSDTTQSEKWWVKAVIEWSMVKGLCGTWYWTGLECRPRIYEGLEAVESAGLSDMHHILEPTECGIIKRGTNMRRRPVPEKIPVLIDVVHPEPRCEMWFGVVKQIIHLVTHPRQHILELGMVQTVFSGIFYQRRRFGNIDTSVFVLPEQCREARLLISAECT